MRRALGIYSRNDIGMSKRLSDPSNPGSSPGVHMHSLSAASSLALRLMKVVLHAGSDNMAEDVAPDTPVCSKLYTDLQSNTGVCLVMSILSAVLLQSLCR